MDIVDFFQISVGLLARKNCVFYGHVNFKVGVLFSLLLFKVEAVDWSKRKQC